MRELAIADLIITANQRQALDLRRSLRLDETRVKAWPDFIKASYAALNSTEQRRYLSLFEQRVLWQRVIQQNSDFALQQDDALVSACMNAWQWLTDWQIPLVALLKYETLDSAWFHRMAQGYLTACQRCHGVDQQQALNHLLGQGPQLKAVLPKTIVFYRFWQAPPALMAFHAHLCTLTINSSFYQPDVRQEPLKACYAAESSVNEIATLVRWSCEHARLYPKQRIACVIQNLSQDRPLIEYYLRQQASVPQVHFSYGKALLDYPLIHVTWRLMRLVAVGDADLEDLTYLSHSPFWAHATDMELMLSRWRGQQLATFPKQAWHSFAPEALLAWWLAFRTLSLKKALPSAWLVHWKALLELSGWPQQSLSDTEQAVLECYETVQVSFAELDNFLGELTHTEAQSHWQALLTQTRFEAPAKQTPQIYFLGLWEALGSDFDVLWLNGVSQYAWPNFPRANALIPFKCQHTYGLPVATGERNGVAEHSLWQALLASCERLIVSYALWNNGASQKPLPYVAAWPVLTVEPVVPMPIAAPRPIDRSRDALPLPDSINQVPGGTAALRSQAHCPFQAFARYRLQLRTLLTPEMALTASERGLLVHQALYDIWNTLKDQQTLLALAPIALTELITTASQKAIHSLNPWRKQGLAKTLLSLEQHRLEALCVRWLSLEAQRPAFQTVHLEYTQEIAFASKTWRLRMDRIDLLASGERVLIDYKTGLASINWQAEPLLEPQLPFYALLNAEPIDALLIAQVTARVQKMQGLARDAIDCGPLGQVKAANGWTLQSDRWALELERLAHDYIAGIAEVRPVKGGSTCLSCDLSSVCRVKDLGLQE